MNGESSRILIVDDSPEDREALRRLLLRICSYAVVEADCGEDGLRQCRVDPPDCVLLDFNLPDVDGGEFLRQLRGERDEMPVPVVVLTGQGSEARAVQVMKDGAMDYLVKGGITAEVLGQAIRGAIDKAGLQRQIQRQRRELERQAAALRDSEERLSITLRSADLGSWHWNVQSGDASFNERWATMLGYRPEEVAQRYDTWQELVHPDDLPGVLDTLTAHLEGRTPSYRAEHRLRRKDGAWIWVLTSGRVYSRDATGQPLMAAGVHIDITDKKQSEQALRERERALRMLIDAAPALIAYLDADLIYRRANAAYERWMGIAVTDICGRHVREVIGEAAWAIVRPHLERALAGEAVSYEAAVPYADRPARWVCASYIPDRDAVGRVQGIVVHTTDLDDRKRAEAEIERRVRELQFANEELARFNRIAVGRELRMIELKKQVNELRVQAGQPPRYRVDFDDSMPERVG